MKLLTCIVILTLYSAVFGAQAIVSNAGFYLFDMFGTGSGNFISVGYERTLTRRLAISMDLSYAKVMQFADRDRPFLMPEIGVSFRGKYKAWQPEIGIGGGIAIDLRSEKERKESSVNTYSIFDGVDDYIYGREEYFLEDDMIEPSFFLSPSIAYYVKDDVRIGARIKARSLMNVFFSMVIVEFGIFTKVDL